MLDALRNNKEASQDNFEVGGLPGVDPEKANKLAKLEKKVRERMRKEAAEQKSVGERLAQATKDKDPSTGLKFLADGSSYNPYMQMGNSHNQPPGSNPQNMMHDGSMQKNPASGELPRLPTTWSDLDPNTRRSIEDAKEAVFGNKDFLKGWWEKHEKTMDKRTRGNSPFSSDSQN